MGNDFIAGDERQQPEDQSQESHTQVPHVYLKCGSSSGGCGCALPLHVARCCYMFIWKQIIHLQNV